MTTAIDLKQKLLEEAAKRDLAGMNVRELEEFARLINAIAYIPEKSYMHILSARATTAQQFTIS